MSRSSSVDPLRPNPAMNRTTGPSSARTRCPDRASSTSRPNRSTLAATAASASAPAVRPRASATSRAARNGASSVCRSTRRFDSSQALKRTWWSSTCSPSSGFLGTTTGRCPAVLASEIVAGPPWDTTTSAAATRSVRSPCARKAWPSATSGARDWPYWTTTCDVRVLHAAQVSDQPTSRSNGWWSVPTSTRTRRRREVTAAVRRRATRGRAGPARATARASGG